MLAPLVLRGAAPDTSVAAFQRPSQARPAYRARSAYLLGFIDLRQGGTRGAERKEQVGIHVATGGIVTPVAILGVPSPLEKALAWVTHRARHLFLLAGADAAALSHPGHPSVSRGWPPATTADAHRSTLLAGPPEFLLAVMRDASGSAPEHS